MAESTGGAIATAAAQTLGNYAITAAANRKQFKYQKEAMALQDQYNRNLWDYQNAYNSPQQQMQRLKAAGLNPYLVYGGASANTGNAGPIQPATVPTQMAATTQLPDFMGKYLNSRQADAQYAATIQSTRNNLVKEELQNVQLGLENLKLMREGLRSSNYKKLNKAELDTQEYIALRMGELFNNAKSQGNLMTQLFNQRSETNPLQVTEQKQEIEFKKNRNELAKLGIYQSDHPAFRILIQAANRMGVPVDELLKRGYDKLKYLFD